MPMHGGRRLDPTKANHTFDLNIIQRLSSERPRGSPLLPACATGEQLERMDRSVLEMDQFDVHASQWTHENSRFLPLP